jgi:hypothetical protein
MGNDVDKSQEQKRLKFEEMFERNFQLVEEHTD